MKIPSITNLSLNLLSGLANNNDSIMPMLFKDTMSNGAIVLTYKKEGGKDDAREKAIEEFGTGGVWLLGIPSIKKIFDVLIIKKFFHLNPDLDVRVLNDDKMKNTLSIASGDVYKKEKEIFSSLKEKNSRLSLFTNEQLYKGLTVTKFALATVFCGIALSKIIKYKQKTTDERIKKEHCEYIVSRRAIDKQVKDSNVYKSFLGAKNKKDNEISFNGKLSNIANLFMYNPIANTSILDGVITGTRLKDARKGERFEVALKEGFQLFFIYALAKPIQKTFEWIGQKAKRPIELDPKVLFNKDIVSDINLANDEVKDILKNNSIFKNLTNNKKAIKIGDKELKDSAKLIEKLFKLNPDSKLLKLLEENGAVNFVKNSNQQNITLLKTIDEEKVIDTFKSINSLQENIKNIKSIKVYKVFAVFANVILAALAMGVLQPKVVIFLRKLFNNGDNRNPAIVQQEKDMKKSLEV